MSSTTPLLNEHDELRALTDDELARMRPLRDLNPQLHKKLKQGQRGTQIAPTKESVSIRLSPEVTAYFKDTGKGWQSRLNDVLVDYVQSNKSA